MNNNYPLIYKLSNNADYSEITNKPKINNVELSGNKSSSDLGLVDTATVGDLTTLTTTEQSSIVGAINEIDGDTATLAAKFPVAIADGGTGATTETGIRTSLHIMGETSLFANASGTSGSITLSDTIANYKAIEILHAEDDYSGPWYDSLKIYNDGASSLAACLVSSVSVSASGAKRIKILSPNIRISGTALTWANAWMATLQEDKTFHLNDLASYNTHKIYKIIGYNF